LRACGDYLQATLTPDVRRILLIDAPAELDAATQRPQIDRGQNAARRRA
jgi:hypothetical protein